MPTGMRGMTDMSQQSGNVPFTKANVYQDSPRENGRYDSPGEFAGPGWVGSGECFSALFPLFLPLALPN